MDGGTHQEFVELCALAVAGDLTAAERRRLDAHLDNCTECREIMSQYELVVSETVPALAADLFQERGDENLSPHWSIEHAEASLMRALDGERSQVGRVSGARSEPPVRKNRWPFAIAAMLMTLFTLAGYQLGVWRGHRPESIAGLAVSPKSNDSPDLRVSKRQDVPASNLVPRVDQSAELARLDLQKIVALKERQRQLEGELAERSAVLESSLDDRADLNRRLTEAQADSKGLQERLKQTADQKSMDSAESLSLTTRINDLNTALQKKDEEIAEERELLQHDRDIRDLMGARDLYIAEIYDIAKTGDTQKPFGRVFYTKDQSLVFYGYDLDQQQGIKNASVFQAWGRRGSDQRRDVSLGMLYQDDANNKRWVLKSNDATTLAQLDAVFVTVEPKGGSPKPTGKPLLFTYLRLNPNHP